MPFEIIRNDITAVKADAIVNTANPRPVIGAGTDSAVHAAAGPELLEARKKLGSIAPGHSEATPAFNLNAKYVLHTVSPAWIDGAHREAELLRQAYDSALELAAGLRCGSVAFPLMASGSYRFPKDLALRTALDAFTTFLMEHEMRIILVIFDQKAFHLSCGLFGELKSYVDENYVAGQSEIEYAAFSRGRGRFADDYPERSAAECSRQTAPGPVWTANRNSRPAACEKPLPTLDELLNDTKPTFSEKLREHLMKYEGKYSAIYGDGNMSRQLFSKIAGAKEYTPKKATVIQLAVGLHLDLEQTQELLGSAGYMLTHSDKRDVVVEYHILTKKYSVAAIDTALYDMGLACLSKNY